jgi:hypothetical protein
MQKMKSQRHQEILVSLGLACLACVVAACGQNGKDTTDGGTTTDAGQDGGTPDAGTIINFPDAAGWEFFGTQHGGPQKVNGVTSDPSGNIWVAGDREGLFLLKPGEGRFHRYTMADGLRPYGYMPDGSDPPGEKYLNVISVAGGPSGSVFVGYEGKPPPPGKLNCEFSWYGPAFQPPIQQPRDPSVYKSGDADRVTLQAGDRISVVHYDISTGPGLIADEPEGREKLCTILRIAYHPASHSVWFGANHGFAWGDANYQGDPRCNGQLQCSGVIEHSHPAINGFADEGRTTVILLTADYWGVSPLANGDVWFGGAARSTLFHYASLGFDWFRAQAETECSQTQDPQCVAHRLDIWPDLVAEPFYPTPSERVDDNVADMAAMPDGSVWVGSFSTSSGLAHYIPGRPTEFRRDLSVDPSGHATGLERDPTDGSLWIGYSYAGLARLKDNVYSPYDFHILGGDITQGRIPDIQSDTYGGHRRLLVAFQGGGGRPGAIGIYTGP